MGVDTIDARAEGGAPQPTTERRQSAWVETMPTLSTSQPCMADSYNMEHERRGKAIIINNEIFLQLSFSNRYGTEVDAANLERLFKLMGFDTVVWNDCTAGKMQTLLSEAAADVESHRGADCFVCVILSHGDPDVVYGTDGKEVPIADLVKPLKSCSTLAGKPKLFFIQACRGDGVDDGHDVVDAQGVHGEDMETDAVQVQRIPVEADFLLAYACVPGYYAWRHTTRGSWFVQALVDVLEKNWERMDLLTMMTRVCRKVAFEFESNVPKKEKHHKKKLVPCITSMLTRDLYFTPKTQNVSSQFQEMYRSTMVTFTNWLESVSGRRRASVY